MEMVQVTLFLNPNVLVSNGMQGVKLCFNRILQLFAGGAS